MEPTGREVDSRIFAPRDDQIGHHQTRAPAPDRARYVYDPRGEEITRGAGGVMAEYASRVRQIRSDEPAPTANALCLRGSSRVATSASARPTRVGDVVTSAWEIGIGIRWGVGVRKSLVQSADYSAR